MAIFVSFCNFIFDFQNRLVYEKGDEDFLVKISNLKFIRPYKFIDEEHSAYE